jgi:hypothetical protein
MITEKQVPLEYTSAHGDVWFVVLSDNVSEANFKYVFDVYVAGALAARIKIVPEPDHSLGIFNAGPVVRSYLSQTYFKGHENLYTTMGADGLLHKTIQVKYGEQYGATDIVTYLDLLVSDELKVYNYYNDILYRRLDNSLAPLTNSYLSTSNPNRKVALKDNMYLYYWNEALDAVDATITTLNAAGATIATQTQNIAAGSELISFNFGPAGINTTFASLIDESVYQYVIDLSANGSVITRTYTLDAWPKYPTYTLHFLNQWGGWDSAPFRMISRRKAEVERKTFSKRNYSYDSNGNLGYTEANAVLRGSTQTYASTYRHKFHLSTDLLTDSEFKWLFQLVDSPLVYLELHKGQYIITQDGQFVITQDGLPWVQEYGQTFFYPVKVEGNSYEFKTRNADKLNALELDIEILEQYNAQFA